MKSWSINIPERPAFMKIVENKQQDCDGYTLQIDLEHLSASIINSNKRRKVAMKTVVKALEGFETIFEELQSKKVNLEAEKELAKERAIAEVEERFVSIETRIENALKEVSETEEIEDKPEEVVSDEPVVDEPVATEPTNQIIY